MSSNLKYTGANIATSYYPSGLAPLDVRSIVDSFSNIQNSLNAFKTSTGDDTSYIGMMVTAYDSGNVYVLTSKNPITWKEIGTDLSKLSGVFQFKGVAESINQAQTILTINSADITKGSNTYTVKCQTIGYEYDMDIYYGWGETAHSILFWTDTPTLTTSSVQYTANTPGSVTKLVLNGVDYYPVDETLPLVDGMKRWENVVGEVVYCDDPSAVYSKDTADVANLLGSAEQVTYEAYDFVPLPDADKYTVNTVASATVAATDNAGHVYQIGENEYASNGQIWVKLGSPVEDWIII